MTVAVTGSSAPASIVRPAGTDSIESPAPVTGTTAVSAFEGSSFIAISLSVTGA